MIASVVVFARDHGQSESAAPSVAPAPSTSSLSPSDTIPPSFKLDTDPLQATGANLAFVANGALHIVDGKTGHVFNVGSGSEPRWSRTGDWLAYRTGPELQEVWLQEANGGSAGLVADHVQNFAWSPTDDRLAVASDDPGTGLKVIDAVGNASRIGPAGATGAVWEFDGQHLAYTTVDLLGDHLFIADTTTPGDRSGRELGLAGLQPATGIQPVLWTRTAGIIAWLHPQHSVSLGHDGAALVAIDPDAGTMRTIATTLTYPDWLAYQPAVSSSAADVVVVSGGNRDAFKDKRTLVCDNALVECPTFPVDSDLAVVDPAWSPDGQHLVMVIADTSSRTVWQPLAAATSLTLASTGDARIGPLLANTSATAHPMWLPDNRHVLAVQGDQLVAFDTNGEDPPTTVVAPLTGPDSDALGPSYYGHTDWTALVAVS